MRNLLGYAFGLMVLAVPVQAATFKAVYTGTVLQSRNDTGEFGVATTFGLDGLDFILTFIYDPSVGQLFETSADRSISGGIFYGTQTPSPIITSFLTINGVTRSVDGSFFLARFLFSRPTRRSTRWI